jgi:hypothetical protein
VEHAVCADAGARARRTAFPPRVAAEGARAAAPPAQAGVKTELLKCIQEEQHESITKKARAETRRTRRHAARRAANTRRSRRARSAAPRAPSDRRSRPPRAQVGDTVCELAAGILEDGGWPELLPFLFQAVQGGPDKLRESALLIFAELATYIGGSMGPYLPTLHAGTAARYSAAKAHNCLRRSKR